MKHPTKPFSVHCYAVPLKAAVGDVEGKDYGKLFVCR